MDKLVQITIGASLLLMAAAVLMFMFSGQSQSFGNFLNNQSNNAQCDLSLQQYKSACNCPPTGPNTKAGNIYSNSDCGWKDTNGGQYDGGCNNYC